MKKKGNFQNSKGFSLVEILIALSILTMVVVFFNKFIIGTKRGMEFTEKHLRAYLFADHLITSIQIKAESSSISEFANLNTELSGDIPVLDPVTGNFEDKLCGAMNIMPFSTEASADYKGFKYKIDFQNSPVTVDGKDVIDFYRPITINVIWNESGSEKKIGINTAIYVKR
ncbi:prepilin-type N-terminal cleavage/methylation domain-containing protein [bacterium]|nr:prepilin-type N-terminal cleavage/methylation domain-containing protein [bacterium]